MGGKLIVIEGLDGSGKATQTRLLFERLRAKLPDVRTISFPRYDSESSALVRGYLSGRFGETPDSVNCYAASSFYAADRYLSYKSEWGGPYNGGTVYLCDRYTTSNAVFQTPKLPENEWGDYLDWLYDFEYRRLGIPRPDAVIYLDMPVEAAELLVRGRYNGDQAKMDIHERDRGFQLRCREAAAYCARHGGWITISCAEGGAPLPAAQISDRVYAAAANRLGL